MDNRRKIDSIDRFDTYSYVISVSPEFEDEPFAFVYLSRLRDKLLCNVGVDFLVRAGRVGTLVCVISLSETYHLECRPIYSDDGKTLTFLSEEQCDDVRDLLVNVWLRDYMAQENGEVSRRIFCR